MRQTWQHLLKKHARAMLRCFVFFGCDYTPGMFNITHATGLKSFDRMAKTQIVTAEDEFLGIVYTAYVEKYRTYKNLFSRDVSSMEETILQSRAILKAFKTEREIIPVPSALHLQYRRTEYIMKMWTGEPMDYMFPEDFGYYKDESGQYKITVNDLTDDYYSLPQKVVKGCFCKGTCGGRCQCKKDEDRANKCSRFTCKSCHCYKRIAEVETENVVLSSRFQDYLDGMSSSSDESELRSDT